MQHEYIQSMVRVSCAERVRVIPTGSALRNP